MPTPAWSWPHARKAARYQIQNLGLAESSGVERWALIRTPKSVYSPAMEWLKFAFDTMIIGALALPWLWLFMRIFFQRGTSKQDHLKFPLISGVSDSTWQTVTGVLIIAMGYFLGSAVSRISSDFFDDREILHRLPTQSSIRLGVYLHEYCDAHSVLVALKLPAELPKLPGGGAAFCEAEKRNLLVAELFRLQEGKLLLVGEEKLGRLHELHDQIEILRGATLNGAILFTLSWFGLCALYRAGLNNAKGDNKISAGKMRFLLKCVSYTPAVAFLLLGVWEMRQHFMRLHEPSPTVSVETIKPAIDKSAPANPYATSNPYEGHGDPPLAEALIVLLGVGGLCVRLTDDSPRLFRNVCLMAAVLTLIGYGSWWWTEVLYDQHVIHSFPTNL
jgi:hypothetical protein